MILKNKNLFFGLIIVSITFIILTNEHFNYEQTLIFGGADGKSYFEISESAPKIPLNKIQPIHSERFFFPYLIGLITKFFDFDIFKTYKILTIILIISINIILLSFFNKIKVSKFVSLILICLVNFNPYLSRFYISIPTIITDLFFHIGLLTFIISFFNKNNFFLLLGFVISFLARQSAIAILIGYTMIVLFDFKNLKRWLVLFFFIAFFLLISLIQYNFSQNTIADLNERKSQYFVTVFGIFLEPFNLKQYLIFFLLPILSFGPIIFLVILNFKKITKKILYKEINILLLIIFTLLIVQPVLSGYLVTGRNIVRLCTLGYLVLIVLFAINIKSVNVEVKNKLILPVFILITIFIWSSHPTFSIFKFMNFVRF